MRETTNEAAMKMFLPNDATCFFFQLKNRARLDENTALKKNTRRVVRKEIKNYYPHRHFRF